MNKVDVVILTKNSASTLEYVLQGVLNSIPFNNIIVVDGNSTDSTLDIAQKFNAKIVKGSWNIAYARYQGALRVETEWFCFVDSDIYIYPSWYKQLARLRAIPRAAWIQGLTLEHSSKMPSYALSKILRYAKYGYIALSNSLIKRELVLECLGWLQNNIHAGEDAVLYEFAKSHGHRVIVNTRALCLHLPDCFFHDIFALFRSGYSDRLRHKHISVMYLGIPILLLKEGLIRAVLTKDPRLPLYFTFILGLSYLLGFFEFDNYQLRSYMFRIDEISTHLEADRLIALEEKLKTELKQFTHHIIDL